MDDGFENQAAAREKALADEANERQRAAVREKALADKLHQAAAREKALADEAKERCEAVAHAKALAAKVLADEQGGQELAVRAKVFAAQALAITTSLPPAPHRMRVQFCLLWGGAFCRLCCRLHHRLPPAVRCKWYANAANLVAVLAAAMAPRLPIHRSTFFAGGAIGPELPTNLV